MARVDEDPQTRSSADDAAGGDDARSSPRAGRAELLRAHRAQPAGPYRLLHPVVRASAG